MATFQHVGGFSATAPSQVANSFAGLTRMSFSTTEVTGTMRWPTTGKFRNMIVLASTAPGAAASGKSLTFTLRQNATTDTAMSVQLLETATTGRYTASDISVSAGDRLTWKCVPVSTPSVGSIVIVVEFEATASGESGYGFTMEILATGANRWMGPLQGQPWGTTSGAAIADIFSVAGTITDGYFDLSGVPGASKSYTANLYLSTDGGSTYVKQDGTGGTQNTTITLTGTVAGAGVTEGSFTGISLAVNPGDLAYWEVAPSGTPNLVNGRCSVRFVATTDGESMMPGSSTASPSVGATSYNGAESVSAVTWSATTTTNEIIGGVKTITLSKFYVAIPAGNPGGAGKQYVYSYRRNNADPTGGPSVTIANTAITGSDTTNSLSLADGDKFNMKVVPTSTPTARRPSWSARVMIGTPPGASARVRVAMFGW